MYKKVSVVLGALALMVAIGFGASPSFAQPEGKYRVCHVSNHDRVKVISVDEAGKIEHLENGHGDWMWTVEDGCENPPQS